VNHFQKTLENNVMIRRLMSQNADAKILNDAAVNHGTVPFRSQGLIFGPTSEMRLTRASAVHLVSDFIQS
jgi:hypothetical protein